MVYENAIRHGSEIVDSYRRAVLWREKVPGTVWGLLGPVAAVGLLGLRSWGWWCAVVFTSIWMAVGGFFCYAYLSGVMPATDYEFITWVLLWPVTVVLLVPPLATRRQLFFPPKPAGEE
jgi:hypothetical protein